MPKPYILSGDPDAGTVEQIDDMLRELYELSGATSAHNLLSALHADTTPADPSAGAMIVGVGTKWTRIQPSVAGTFPRFDGSNTTFAAVNLTSDVAGTLPVTKGGTGLATVVLGDVLYASAADTLARLAKDANATRYLSNTGAGNIPAWARIDLTNGVTGALPSTNGGTGQTTYTTGAMVYYGGTVGQLDKLALGANNTFLQAASGVGPVWSAFALPAGVNQGDIFFASSTSVVAALAKDATATRYLANSGSSNNPAWAAITKGVWNASMGGVNLGAGATRYMGTWGAAALETAARFPIPINATVKNLYCRSDQVPGAGQTYTYNVYISAAATALVATTSGAGANTSSDLTHSAAITPGEWISIRVDASAGATAAQHWAVVELASST